MLQAKVSDSSFPSLAGWLPYVLIFGGFTQVIYYIVSIIYGLTEGSEIYKPEDGLIFYVAGATFTIPIVCYGISMLEMGNKLRAYAPRLIATSMMVTVLSLLFVSVGLVVAILADIRYGNFSGMGQISSLVGVTLLAVGVLRNKALSPVLGWMLLGVGLITFPVIILFAIPMGIPIYYTSELPFAAEGLAWIGFAWILYRSK